MKNLVFPVALLLGVALNFACLAHDQRSVAVTIDDLPGPPRGLVSNDIDALRDNTVKLLKALRARRVPAMGFVNEGKLFLEGETAEQAKQRTAILELWPAGGFELGNHTYSHISLNATPLDTFQENVLRGETVTRPMLSQYGMPLRYFRHPYLHVGMELDKRRGLENFLQEHGYIVAPVTVDNEDYVFAAVYAAALRRGDRSLAKKVAAEYQQYFLRMFDFYEGVSQRLVGREIPQVLLLHANTLNADYFGKLAMRLKARGYRFVTLQQALQDEVYRRPDLYVGQWGFSWLHHWEITEGKPRSPMPDPAPWVMQAYEALNK